MSDIQDEVERFLLKQTIEILYQVVMRGKIDFENLLTLGKNAKKPSTIPKYFSFTYVQSDWGVGNGQGVRIFLKSSQSGG